MARFYDVVGYGESVETPAGSGVHVDQITEMKYYGEVIRNTRRLTPDEHLNNEISVGNSISIIADEYATKHFFAIKYIRWEGVNWKVTTVEVRPPRLILALGTVYNGPVLVSTP